MHLHAIPLGYEISLNGSTDNLRADDGQAATHRPQPRQISRSVALVTPSPTIFKEAALNGQAVTHIPQPLQTSSFTSQ
jgi:hypothetical protein